MPPGGELRLAAVSFLGLVLLATTGCLWLLFDRPKPGPPCRNIRMVDTPSLHRPPDDVIWSWLQRKPANGLVYVNYYGDTERAAEDLGRYQGSHPGANAIDYFTSLGMSCLPSRGQMYCRRELTAHYVCANVQNTSKTPPRYEGLATVTVRIDGAGKLHVTAGIKGTPPSSCWSS